NSELITKKTIYTKILTLPDFEALSQVLPMSFHRSHRAFVVNFDHVSSYMVRDLKMRDGALLSVSRSYQRSIKEAFHQYLIESRELEK
ncbi:LytTR family DNA-binding domain-containing protein, partial [Dubosiella newyorkensis]|uniref:LytTR family DNA-binding domain-containing protein n=1 Tax=Dubosiella newyorkensis TaxID=1862672 RepID=UPI0023F01470